MGRRAARRGRGQRARRSRRRSKSSLLLRPTSPPADRDYRATLASPSHLRIRLAGEEDERPWLQLQRSFEGFVDETGHSGAAPAPPLFGRVDGLPPPPAWGDVDRRAGLTRVEDGQRLAVVNTSPDHQDSLC